MDKHYDVVIIGAGPGGYPCALRLGHLKKKVLVIEKEQLGGLCLNWGCIPTKALTHASEMIDFLKHAGTMGLQYSFQGIDTDALRTWKQGIVKRLRLGIESLFRSYNIEYKSGSGKVISEHEIEITANGAHEAVQADYIVIATGTRASSLPGFAFDGKHIIDTTDALEIADIPQKLLVIGAGASGLEMGTIYSRLGSTVTIIEMMGQVLPGMDNEVCEGLHKILKKTGIEIVLNAQASGYTERDDRLDVVIKKQDGEIKDVFDKVLITVGRRPDDAAFKELRIKTDEKGFIKTDNCLRTNVARLFAIGDITGPPLLAHKATRQGIDVAEIICGLKQTIKPRVIPSCVFTIPPLSSAGLTEKEAHDQGYNVRIGRFPYRASGKALSMGAVEGLAKIVGDEKGKLLGLHILGAESSSLIAEAIIAIDHNFSVADLAESIHPHPTLTEVICEAAENFYKKAIHIQNK